jgi:hypothetical protein
LSEKLGRWVEGEEGKMRVVVERRPKETREKGHV